MATQLLKRGAIPTPKHEIQAAVAHSPLLGAPLNFIVAPKKLSMWGNDKHGDCVTAEEAFAKACHNPEIFIPEAMAVSWAKDHGVLEGAYITKVMDMMRNDGFPLAAHKYDDGPYFSVKFADANNLHSAIALGPVKIGVAANQLEAAHHKYGGQGWFGVGFKHDSAEDHCVSLCGYGTIAWLAQQLHLHVPAGIDGSKPGYALFTWNSIGIIDVPSMIAITHEAWVRNPTTVVK